MRKRQTYTTAFKAEAIRLLERSGTPPEEWARELGIRRNKLYKWQEQMAAHGEQAFPGSGRLPEPNTVTTTPWSRASSAC